MSILGIDTGGTFTDFVLVDEDGIRVHKVLSTPEAPERAILQGIEELGVDAGELQIAHGSTVATNAVLEGRGAKTAYVGNAGFESLLLIGRQNRRRLYDLTPPRDAGPLADIPRFGVSARMDAEGRELTPLDGDELSRLASEVEQADVESVAVNLLFSFRSDEHERRIRDALPESLFVSLSSEVLPEYREYERGMATWLNAYVGPKVADYIDRLRDQLPGVRLRIMQSSGGLMDADAAAHRAVHLLLSGPAGGLRGALALGREIGCERLLTFDMGGTSSDVAMLDGEITLTEDGEITAGESKLPVPVPMVDLHTIGAGGGSIARIDEGGLLRVGPASAGADPGPACYGRGGEQPTVTDANLVLGRIPESGFGSGMRLDRAAAERALAPLAERMGRDVRGAAEGILEVVEEAMAGALRVISVERGRDPRDFVLASFGGAGGLHVCALAERLGMRQALVPIHAGVLSALGMTVTPPTRELSQSIARPLEALTESDVSGWYRGLEGQARRELEADGVDAADIRVEWAMDLRYRGQTHALRLPWSDETPLDPARFHERHKAQYGHALSIPVELAHLRVSATGPAPSLESSLGRDNSSTEAEPAASGGSLSVCDRHSLPLEQSVSGPLLVTDAVGSTWVAEGWSARRDSAGNIRLEDRR